MPMPTTRRGRFLYYKERSLRRRKKAYRRLQRFDPALFDSWNRAGTRPLMLDGYRVKQVPLTDYVPAEPVHANDAFLVSYRIKPGRGVWGVLFSPPIFNPGHPNDHARVGYVGYVERRVYYTPRLKHLPVDPSRLPYDPSRPEAYWPFEFYPSGQPNSHWVP